ncbi:forkhead box protein H1 [Thalassophryne amazonica]|uniref:forkhead box protein H1 n=1 Tax=Thalassophryne amazonica TaxID=390379 RepID=UPI001471AD20|nr:forkhead box protein H1 [Thalassophryne amazonica]
MQNRTEMFGAQLPGFAGVQRGPHRRRTTCLAKVAMVLQQAPDKMLTFTELMDKLEPIIYENRKAAENNIRVCLTTYKCFVKIPLIPDSLNCKRNYWKLDPNQITVKMVRRHFTGLLHVFPELASKMERENRNREWAVPSTEPTACRGVQIRCKVKFRSSFSIESLLKSDTQTSTAPPQTGDTAGEERQRRSGAATQRSFTWALPPPEQLLLPQASAGSSTIFSAGGDTRHVFPVCTRAYAAPCFSSPPCSYITYPVPAFSHHAPCFWL